MRRSFVTAGFAAVLTIVPMLSLAAATVQSTPPAKHASSSPATHATTGVVKSVDDSTLVISHKNGKKEEDMTFMLNSSTKKEGTLAAGEHVSVRYHDQGSSKVATAVTVQSTKPAKAPVKK